MAIPSDAKARRAKAEKLIYDVLDQSDVTGTNTEYYKNLFAKMNDQEFYKFFEKR